MKLQSFFNPTSIAIVGVSTNAKKVGHLVAKNMMDQGFKDNLYFVHLEASELLGKKVYKTLKEIDKKIDLVILALPAKIAIPYLKEVHEIGCQNVIMYAAGFKETGEEGKLLEQQLIEITKSYGITLLGPNCLGYINTNKNINATFLKGISPKGNIGFISQSGALGSVMVDYFAGHINLGFSYFISLGNKSVLDESDTLEFLQQDEDTKVIGMYLEDVKDGDKFRAILQKTCKIKPVVILKSGSTQEGSKAALSHTGGMVGSDEVYDAVFAQSGAIRAKSYSEFINLLRLFSFNRIPSSRSTLVLSNAGGVGVLLADDLITKHLSLVTISEYTKKELYDAFGEVKKITVHNPIDLLGDASAFDYKKAISSTLDESNIGSVIVLLTPQANTEILKTAQVVAEAQKQFDKPIYPVFMGKKSLERTHHFFEQNQIPYFKTYDGLPDALDKINTYREWKLRNLNNTTEKFNNTFSLLSHKGDIQTILNLHKGKPFLDMKYSLQVLKLLGIPTPDLIHINSLEELHKQAANIHFPVVVKLASETITHKTEVGGVIPYVKTYQELEDSFRKIQHISGSDGVYIQPMVKGHELFVGAKRDSIYGTVLVVGLGGVYAELIKEIVNFVYPFTYSDFIERIEKTKIASLLKGFRGSAPVDVPTFYEIIMKIGSLLEQFSSIQEIDINPLFISNSSCIAVDSRIILPSS